MLSPDVKHRPGQKSVPENTAGANGQVLDFDRVYELEQDLGTARIADHLGEAIHAIADLQKALRDAVSRGDYPALRPMAESLALEAAAIGLTGLSGSASHLLDGVHNGNRDLIVADRVAQLDAKFKSGASALTRAYPALAG